MGYTSGKSSNEPNTDGNPGCHKPLIWGWITPSIKKNADFRDGQWHFLFTTLADSYNPFF